MHRRVAMAVLTLALLGCRGGDEPSNTKIIGGHTAGDRRFMAGVLNDGDPFAFCGGTLIAPRVVLTAAHCAVNPTARMRVALGIRLNKDLSSQKTVAVEGTLVHPGYNPDTMKDDVALLFLESYDAATLPGPAEPLALNDDATLPDAGAPAEATVVGWGNSTSFGEIYEDDLMEATVPIVPVAQCKAATSDYAIVTDTNICAGDYSKGGIDSCQGDSGGPLLTTKADGTAAVAGIVSWGIGCAQAGKPGVYTRVSSFKAWIDGAVASYGKTRDAFDGADVSVLAGEQCYAKLMRKRTNADGPNTLVVGSSYAPGGAFTPTSAVAPAGDPDCELSVPGLGGFAARVVEKDGTATIDLRKDGAPATGWTASVVTTVKTDLTCGGSSTVRLVQDPASLSYVQVGGSIYVIGSASTTAVRADATAVSCKEKDASVKFVSQPAATGAGTDYLAEVQSPDTDAQVVTYSLQPYGVTGAKLTLALKGATTTTGTLTLANTATDDIFTWKLTCDTAFDLLDGGTRYKPVASDGEFVFHFSAPESPLATIRHGEALKLKYETPAALPATAKPSCALNGSVLDVSYTPPSS